MKLYTINEKYINYLKNFSENIRYNKNQSRPYVGVVLQVAEHSYFVPMSSPKEKHLSMKDTVDFMKIDKGKLGALNFNNMIPVPSNYAEILDFKKFDRRYSKLLSEQIRWLERNRDSIKRRAEKLYFLITTRENTVFHKRCNNFLLLEKKANIVFKSLEDEAF